MNAQLINHNELCPMQKMALDLMELLTHTGEFSLQALVFESSFFHATYAYETAEHTLQPVQLMCLPYGLWGDVMMAEMYIAGRLVNEKVHRIIYG